jgi:hypothetical protein
MRETGGLRGPKKLQPLERKRRQDRPAGAQREQGMVGHLELLLLTVGGLVIIVKVKIKIIRKKR